MSELINNWLGSTFHEVAPLAFYRDMFPEGELSQKGEKVKGKYTGIAICISKTEKVLKYIYERNAAGEFSKKVWLDDNGEPLYDCKRYRFSVFDDLSPIEKLQSEKDWFCLMAPISYAGKRRIAENARFAYGITIDLDFIRVVKGLPIGLINLWEKHINEVKRVPVPTYIVSSGSGVHLYYLFTTPVPLFREECQKLKELKNALTKLVWHTTIVDIVNEKEIQYEGIYQGFRMVGTPTKNGEITRAYKTGNKVSIDYFNKFVPEEAKAKEVKTKSRLTLQDAKEMYPQWYKHKIVEGKKGPSNPWPVNRGVYEWWKRELWIGAKLHARYYCLLGLAIIAKKCSFYHPQHNPNPVTYEELRQDAFGYFDLFESLTTSEDNHFTHKDVYDALQGFSDSLITYPLGSICCKAQIERPLRQKRNGRTNREHLHKKMFVNPNTGRPYKNPCRDHREDALQWMYENGKIEGRPKKEDAVIAYIETHPKATKKEIAKEVGVSYPTLRKYEGDRDIPTYREGKRQIVLDWRKTHPEGKKADCQRDTGLSYPTVLKWWETILEKEN